MSYEIYKIIHLLGLFMLFLAYGGVLTNAFAGQTKEQLPQRKFIFMTHGLGLLLALVGGFGLLARTGAGWPIWIFMKMGLWVIMLLLANLIFRKPQLAKKLWVLIIALGGFATFLVNYKPF